jgi:hypothetical protein
MYRIPWAAGLLVFVRKGFARFRFYNPFNVSMIDDKRRSLYWSWHSHRMTNFVYGGHNMRENS